MFGLGLSFKMDRTEVSCRDFVPLVMLPLRASPFSFIKANQECDPLAMPDLSARQVESSASALASSLQS